MFNLTVPTIRTIKQSCQLAVMVMSDNDNWLYDVRKTDNQELDRAIIFIYNSDDTFVGYC